MLLKDVMKMENVYLIINETIDENGNKNEESSLHNLVFDEIDNAFHLYSHDKNIVRWKDYTNNLQTAKSNIEERFEEFKKEGIIKDWKDLGNLNI